MMYKNSSTEETANNDLGAVRRSCLIVRYGEVERLCKKCGYVMWEEKGKSDNEIIDNMIKAGFPSPSCRNNYA